MLRLPQSIPFVYSYATTPPSCPGYLTNFSPLGFVVLGLGRLGLWSTPSGAHAAAEFVCAATLRIDYKLWLKNCISSYSGLLLRTVLMITDEEGLYWTML